MSTQNVRLATVEARLDALVPTVNKTRAVTTKGFYATDWQACINTFSNDGVFVPDNGTGGTTAADTSFSLHFIADARL